jgi:hypothetical protein
LETLSKAATAVSYKKRQDKPEIAVYDGRYEAGNSYQTATLPIQAFDPIFDIFNRRLSDQAADIEPEFVRRIGDFVDASSAIYSNETTRNEALRSILEKILGADFDPIENKYCTVADGAFTISVGGMDLNILIWESKNEIGEGGCDPSTQAGLSMREIWADPIVIIFL